MKRHLKSIVLVSVGAVVLGVSLLLAGQPILRITAPNPRPLLARPAPYRLLLEGGTTGAVYVIQTSTNLVDWQAFLSGKSRSEAPTVVGDVTPTNRAQFFRVAEYGPGFSDTNPPSWTNGVNGRLTVTSPGTVVVSWDSAVDDVGVSEYRIYLNGAEVTSLPAAALSYQLNLDLHKAYDLRIQAADASGNATAVRPLILIPGDGLLALSDDGGRIYVADYLPTNVFQTNAGFGPVNLVRQLNGGARGVALGDFDRDGILDLIGGGANGDTLTPYFFKGNGDGTFAAPVALPTATGSGGYMMDATVGDFDGDGNLDFVANGNGRFVYFYWGNGDGTFTVEVKDWGDYGRGTVTGDFNEDGREDIVRAQYSGPGTIRLFLSNGDRTFTETNMVGQYGSDRYGVAAGDFDEDGHLDILANNSSSGDIVFYKGAGDCTFTSLGTNGPWGNLNVHTYAGMDAFDYSGDGHLDLVMGTVNGQAFFWPGKGDGTFSSNSVTIATGMTAFWGVSAPPRPPRVEVGISPVDPVTNINSTITFTGVGSAVTANDFYRWSFGDTGTNPFAWTFGTNSVNQGRTVSHTYTNEGRFLTRLWHTTTNGINSVRGTWATIQGAPPVANPGGPYSYGEGVATQAVWYATLDGSASTDDYGIVSYIWSFGDGTGATSSSPTISHGWTNSGVWTVMLTVIDAARQTSSKSTTVTFTAGQAPIAVINGPDVVDETAAKNGVWSATFYATNSTDDFGIWKYAWNFGNGRTSTGPIGQTTYSAVGTNVVALTVTDNANQTNSTTLAVWVKANGLPVPVINGPHLLTVNESTNGLWYGAWDGLASTDDTGIYQYNWSFGDGATGTGPQVNHAYGAQGVYPLTLTVTDNGNQSVTATQNVVVVAGNPPVARITASTLVPEGAQPVSFSAANSTSDNGIYLYLWQLPQRLFDFSGQVIDSNQWQVVNGVQNDKLTLTGQNAWGRAYFYSIGARVARGTAMEGRVDTPSASGGNAMVGLRDRDFSSGSYTHLEHAIYFVGGAIQIYELGSYRANPTNYSPGTSYDFRIETKLGGGARYYLRASGTGQAYTQIYESNNYSDASLSFGADVESGVFSFGNMRVQPSWPYRDMTTPVIPGGTVTLTVVDNALLTNSTSVVISPVTGAPPVAVISGPTNGLSGVEIAYDGYGSSDDYGIASYVWDFGDGSPGAMGPAVTHHWTAAGTYTNTLTVTDYANQSSSASLVVQITGANLLVHVPWQIVNGIELPHQVYAGKTNTLKAVARGMSAPFTYIWDYGDGSGTVTNAVTNAAEIYNLEARHAYAGGDGTPYYATIRLVETNGAILSDTYPILLRPKTLDVEMNVAIDEGLWYLQKVQSRYDVDPVNKGGYWTYAGWSVFHINVTASAVQAFGINGHFMGGDASRDPYVDTVQRGVNYLLSRLTPIAIGPQTYGDPDANHNGIGLTSPDDRPPYEVGPVMDALVAVGQPEYIAAVGGANVKGRAFRDLMQDMVDVYAWGQGDGTVVAGGWCYGWNSGECGDNSVCQWAAIGMTAAERYWAMPAPQWVKDRNLIWVAYSAGAQGFGYRGPGDGEATTPSAMVQLAWQGMPTTNALWLHGENFLANNWTALMSYNNVYSEYAIAKALRLANPPVQNFSLNGLDWFRDPSNGMARNIINRQFPDGSWIGSGRAYDVDYQECTAWSTIILTSSLFQRGPVAVINVRPNPAAVGYPVVLDGRSSYHQHPAYKIIEYRWIFDSSKGVDFEHPDAIGPVVTNIYSSLSTNTVSLQVRDNGTPQLTDVGTVVVQVTVPPYPPTADAGGPYVACVSQDVHLDGSGSFCVDAAAGNFIQSWDWEVNYQVPLTFDQGVSGEHAVITNGYSTSGPHQIGLRVKNANSIVYPNAGVPDATADAFTTVYVYDRVIPDLKVRPKGNKAQLTWTKAGDYGVILRSMLGPDRGFTQVGQTASTYATFLDEAVDYNTQYYYRVYAYVNGRPDPIGVSDPVFMVSPPRSFDEHAPSFASTPLRLAKVGQLYEVTLDVKNPENSLLSFALLQGPTNMMVNATNGLVDFTPVASQLGNQFLSFQVSNHIGRDVLSYTLFVFPATNHPPVANANGPYAALTGEAIQFSSTGTSDPDNNTLRYFWNFGDGSLVDTNPNPTHVYGGAGDYLAMLFVNDGYGGTASSQAHVQIKRPDRPPVIVLATNRYVVRLGETVVVDGSKSFSLDGNPLSFTWVWGDGTTTNNTRGTSPHLYTAPGDYTGSLIVADNQGMATTNGFQVIVGPPNQPPTIVLTVSTNTPFQLSTVTFDATGTTDPENDPVTFAWDFGDHFKTTGSLVTHAFNQLGNVTVTLTASDNHGGVSVATQLLQVIDAPPVFVSTPPLMVRAGSPYTYAPVVTNAAGTAMTFQLVQGPATMSVDTNSGALTWLPGTNNLGLNPVDLRATDANGGSGDQSFTVVVTTPLGPQIDLEPTHIEMTNVVVDSQTLALSGTATVYFRNNGTDPVPVPFAISLFVDATQDGTYSTNGDRVVGYGLVPAGFTAGESASVEMTVNGQALFKDAPLYAFMDSQDVVQEYNKANNIKRSGFDANTNQPPVVDLSSSRLEVDRTMLPTNATLTARLGNSGLVPMGSNVPMAFYVGDPKAGGVLIGVSRSTEALAPGAYQDLSVTWNAPLIAKHTVFVVADQDGHGTNLYPEINLANNTFSLELDLSATLPPMADAGMAQSVYVGDTVALNGSASKDPQGRPLTYRWSVVSLPIGSQTQLTATNTLSPSFKADLAGQYAVSLVVNNGLLDSTNQSSVTVTAVDTNIFYPPSISSTPTFQGMVGVPYSYQVSASDPQSKPLTFRLAKSPPGMTVITNTGLIQWTPTNTGSFFVQVNADGVGGYAFQTYTLTVIAFTNLPPQFTSMPVTTAAPNTPYAYTAVAVSPVGNPLTYALTQSPPGMSINGQSGVISWTPAASQLGANPVTVSASDGKGGVATQGYRVVVLTAGTGAPVVQPIANQTVTAPTAFAAVPLDRYVTDPKYPANQITWTASGTNLLSVTIDSNRVATVTYPAGVNVAEQITFLATDPAGLSGYASSLLTVIGNATPPVAVIANLSADNTTSIDTAFFELLGTADDPGVPVPVAWRLGLYDANGGRVADVTPAPVDAGGWHEGRVPAGGSFGQLDFTTVRNGSYTLLLEVQANGQTVNATAQIALNSELKLGQMKFSQQDLILPVRGVSLSVVRTYDSLNTAAADFGYSWSYAVSDLGLTIDEQRAETQDAIDNTSFSLRTGGGWDVTLDMPDTGRRVTFSFSLLQGFLQAQAFWTPPPGVNASLVPTVSSTLITLPGGIPPIWQAAGEGTDWQAFDWPGFVLTTADGTQYRIDRTDEGEHFYAADTGYGGFVHAYSGAFISRITQPTGDHIEFDRSGSVLTNIAAFDTHNLKLRSVSFVRDGQKRITAVYLPENLDTNGTPTGPASMAYAYDASGNLVTATKLKDGSNSNSPVYSTTSYLYGDSRFPHLLTEVKDDRGLSMLRAEFDAAGRLVATIDAFGNRSAINHDLAGRTDTIFDRQGNPTQLAYDERGNVVAKTDPLGNTTRYTFDHLNHRTSKTDALGRTTLYQYDASGNELSFTDALGFTTQTAYDASGNPLSVTNPVGRATLMSYDGAGRMLSVTNPLGQTTRFNWDATGNLTNIVDAFGHVGPQFQRYQNGDIASVTNVNGRVIQMTYDPLGNRNSTSLTWTNPANPSDLRQVVTRTIFDSAGNVVAEVNPLGQTNRLDNDSAGRLGQYTDAYGNITRHLYDARGSEVAVQYADDTQIERLFDENGRLVLETDRHPQAQPALATRATYDAVGRLVRSERLTNVVVSVSTQGEVSQTAFVSAGPVLWFQIKSYDAVGNLLVSSNSVGQVALNEYDVLDRRTATVDSFGNRVEFGYDATGNRTRFKDAEGNETSYIYSPLGRLTRIVYSDGTTSQMVYDDNDRLVAISDQAGQQRTFGYDAGGRLVSVTLPAVADPETGQSAVSPQFTLANDVYDHPTVIQDPKGRQNSFVYDELGRELSHVLPMGQSDSKAYRSDGRLGSMTDFLGQQMDLSYDSLGRVTGRTFHAAGTTNATETVSYAFDSAGRLSSIQTASGVTSYLRDGSGRVLSVQSPEGVINYEYDPGTGLRTRTFTDHTDLRYAYDPMGRLQTLTVLKRNGTILSPPEVSTYDYTPRGSRKSLTLANGVRAEYQYDALNRLVTLTHRDASNAVLSSYAYGLAADGSRTNAVEIMRCPGNDTATNVVRYAYDALHRLVRETRVSLKDGSTNDIVYTYDLVGNRLQRRVTVAGKTLTTSYSYDDNDRLLMESNAVSMASGSAGLRIPVPVRGADGTRRTLYYLSPPGLSYYFLRSLPYLIGAAFVLPAVFIPRRRWRRMRIFTSNLSPDRAVMPRCLAGLLAGLMAVLPVAENARAADCTGYGAVSLGVWGLDGAVTTYAYDANGALVQKSTTGPATETVAYGYDLHHHLVSAQTSRAQGGHTLTTSMRYQYNDDGIRVRSEQTTTLDGAPSGGRTNVFLVDSFNLTDLPQVLEELPDVGAAPTTTYSVGLDVVAQTSAGGSTRYFLYDGNGATRQLATETGAASDLYGFDAFGVLLGATPETPDTLATSVLFGGGMYDTNLGLHYLRARYYDSTLGRFTQSDPLAGRSQDPQTLHRYAYCLGDPVNHKDPTGLETLPDVLTTLAVLGILTLALQGITGGVIFYSGFKNGGYRLDGVLVSGSAGFSGRGVIGEGILDVCYYLKDGTVWWGYGGAGGLSPTSVLPGQSGFAWAITAGLVFNMTSPGDLGGWGFTASFPLSVAGRAALIFGGRQAGGWFGIQEWLLNIAQANDNPKWHHAVVQFGFSKSDSYPAFFKIGANNNSFSWEVSWDWGFEKASPRLTGIVNWLIGAAKSLAALALKGAAAGAEGFLDFIGSLDDPSDDPANYSGPYFPP